MKFELTGKQLQVVVWVLSILLGINALMPIVSQALPWKKSDEKIAARVRYDETRIDSLSVRAFQRSVLAELTAICVVEPKGSEQWVRAAQAIRSMRTVHFDSK
jgi:hypothetical protein